MHMTQTPNYAFTVKHFIWDKRTWIYNSETRISNCRV